MKGANGYPLLAQMAQICRPERHERRLFAFWVERTLCTLVAANMLGRSQTYDTQSQSANPESHPEVMYRVQSRIRIPEKANGVWSWS